MQSLTIQDNLSVAKTFYESGMFPDIKSSSQAMVKIMAGQEFGIPPFAAMSGIHIIAGKPTIGAGLMAQRIKSSGKYDYNVIELSETVCNIQFYNIQIESIKKDSIEKYSTILINFYEIKIQTLTDVLTNLNDLL